MLRTQACPPSVPRPAVLLDASALSPDASGSSGTDVPLCCSHSAGCSAPSVACCHHSRHMLKVSPRGTQCLIADAPPPVILSNPQEGSCHLRQDVRHEQPQIICAGITVMHCYISYGQGLLTAPPPSAPGALPMRPSMWLSMEAFHSSNHCAASALPKGGSGPGGSLLPSALRLSRTYSSSRLPKLPRLLKKSLSS